MFQLPTDLIFNRAPVHDPSAYAKDWVRDSLEALR
jgi:hypothetical protein